MVSCGVSWNGLLPPYFVEAGVKINTEVYVGVLRNYLLPSSEAALGPGFVFQQDNAPSHRS
eukprot:3141537-Amphidinium_carterae.1